MKKIYAILLAIPLLVFVFSGVAFGWGAATGDGSRYTQLQETAVFYNNTSSTHHPDDQRMYHGQAVILDVDGTGVTSGTTMGAYVEKPVHGSGSSDSVYVVGVVAGSGGPYAVSSPVVVVTKGAAIAQVEDLSDAIAAGDSVGCGDTIGAGNVGEGTNLGVALENGDGTDADEIAIWVCLTGGQ